MSWNSTLTGASFAPPGSAAGSVAGSATAARSWSGGRDARLVPSSRAAALAGQAAEAAELRGLVNHPDVMALSTERVRKQVDVLVWLGIALGLGFTMVNVQTFAAAGAAAWSLAWIAAWLLDPMVSLVLVAVLRAEQITARHQVPTGKWVNRTKWFTFAATYIMNTWQSWATGSPAGIVLHSVPPMLVFLASETAPVLRDRLTEAVNRAAHPTNPTEAEQAATAPVAALPDRTGPQVAAAWWPAGVDPMADTIEFAPIPTTAPASARPPRTPTTARRNARTNAGTGEGKRRVRSIEELRAERDAAIAAGTLPAAPSADAIRRHLAISPARARVLRDELTNPTTAPPRGETEAA